MDTGLRGFGEAVFRRLTPFLIKVDLIDPGRSKASGEIENNLLLWASNLLLNAGSRQDEFQREDI